MNRRKPQASQQRPSLRRLLHHAHLRVALLAMGLTSLSLTLVSLLALSTYAGHNLQLIARSLAYPLEAAVVFNERVAVHDALEQICKTEEIAQVAVFDKDGELLASLDTPGNTVLNSAEQSIARLLLPDVVIQPITYQGQQIGALHLSGQGTTLLRFLIGGLLGLLASLGLKCAGCHLWLQAHTTGDYPAAAQPVTGGAQHFRRAHVQPACAGHPYRRPQRTGRRLQRPARST